MYTVQYACFACKWQLACIVRCVWCYRYSHAQMTSQSQAAFSRMHNSIDCKHPYVGSGASVSCSPTEEMLFVTSMSSAKVHCMHSCMHLQHCTRSPACISNGQSSRTRHLCRPNAEHYPLSPDSESPSDSARHVIGTIACCYDTLQP